MRSERLSYIVISVKLIIYQGKINNLYYFEMYLIIFVFALLSIRFCFYRFVQGLYENMLFRQ